MPSILDQVEKDYIVSYKAKDLPKISVLRMLKSAIKNAKIEKKDNLSDQDIYKIISKEIKQRRESAEQYKTGNRLDLAEKELDEIKYFEIYLPTQLTDDEINKIIQETISSSGLDSISDFGKIMGLLIPKISGKADGSKVSALLKQILSK